MTESSSQISRRNSGEEKSKESSSNDKEQSAFRKLIRTACEKGHMENAELLLEHEGLLEHEYEDNKRPIHFAVENQHEDIVELLITKGCDIECEDINEWRPIHYACSSGNERIVKLLIENECKIECATTDMDTALHIACKNGHTNIVELLLAKNCDIYCQNNQNETPLSLAAKHSHEDCVRKIECSIKTKIVECVRNNDEDRFSEMYSKIISNRDSIYCELSIWDIAVSNRANKVIKYFKKKMLDDEELNYLTKTFDNVMKDGTSTSLGEMILGRCIRDRQTEGFYRFCTAEIVNGPQTDKSSFLSKAAKDGRRIFVKELLQKSVYKKEIWDIAINDANHCGHKDIAEDISRRKQLIERRSKRGFSLLHTAVLDNDDDMVKYILEKNIVDADINHEIFGTALALAHSMCYVICINVLEQFNVSSNTQNKFLQTPLHEAITSGTIEKCKYLIERCDNINKEGFKDLTALDCAVMEGHYDLCEQLVQYGADAMKYCRPLSEFDPRASFPVRIHETKISMSESSHSNDAEIPLEIHIQSDENMLINLFFIDQGLCSSSSTHQLLKTISANLNLCQTVPVLPMMSIVSKCFDRNYKIPIAEKVKSETDLDVNDNLAVDCLCLSLQTTTKYIAKDSSTNYYYNDYIIGNIFDKFSQYGADNAVIKRIVEDILCLFCNILKMSNTKINYEFWNKGLMMFLEDESWSNLIRIRAYMILTKINLMRNLTSTIETKLTIVKCLITEIIMAEDKMNLVFRKGEIIHAIADAMKILKTMSAMIFHSDEGLENRLGYLNEILCLVIKFGQKQQNGLFSSILQFTQAILTSFTNHFKRPIIQKFKENICLDKKEKTLINCFCNSLNIIGEISTCEVKEPFLKDLYDTIYAFLEAFAGFTHRNIYAVRICEVLLYCLCNVIQISKLPDCDKWSEILWRYYDQFPSYKLIKMAAAICFVYATKKDELKDKITKIEIFLNENLKKVNKDCSQNYLGFSLKEINDALSRCLGQTKRDHFEIPCKNKILTLTTRENALTICLKMNKTIYPFFLPRVNEAKCCDASNNSLLHLAAVCLLPDLCKSLVGGLYSINEVNNEGNNCLQELLLNVEETAVNDNIDQIIETVRILMEAGVDLNAKTRTGLNIFQLASRLNNEKLLLALLTKESVLFITKSDLELSFKRKWYTYVKNVLEKVPEECLSKSITKDVYREYLRDSPPEVIKLMWNKSDESVQKSMLNEVVYYAATKEDDDLFDKFENIDEFRLFANGETLLTQLIKDKTKIYYMKLITSKNNWKYIDVTNSSNQTPLQIAIEMDQIDLADRLIAKTKTINNQDHDGETALTLLLKKIMTCDVNIEARWFTSLDSMINNKCANIYHISPDKNVLKKNVKEMIQNFTKKSPSNAEQILQILTNEKCETCDTRHIEYVYRCGHKFCTDCGHKFEECPREEER